MKERPKPRPRPATLAETAAMTGLFPDLFPDDLPPVPPGRRFEVTVSEPGSSSPIMLIPVGETEVESAFATAFAACRDMDTFEVTVRPLG